ncbi:unnamed protein product [Urochloa decumbens]|uniref:Uncharacterized protein n=1 Tax=Urochloa decumbens TaxID=240449 RepID=A0ABC8XZU5_9POAL
MMEESVVEKQRAPKRRRDGRGSDCGRAATPRRHLYLVFDDWSRGYSIHKVDLSPSGTADRRCQRCGGRRHRLRRRGSDHCLPPPLFRFQAPDAPRGDTYNMPPYFSAVGSNIVAVLPSWTYGGAATTCYCFDVHARSLVFAPRHREALDSTHFPVARHHQYPIYFSVGDRLFVLGTFSFQVLDMAGSSSVSSQLEDLNAMSWRELPDAPVASSESRCHAVAPDGQTIFVSAGIVPADEATYSFHTAEDGSSASWRHHGGWALPFDGRGYYDGDLNAWVGLSLYSLEIGHVVACELVSGAYGRRPAWKFSKENLFSEDPAEGHMGATFVDMGANGRSRFCLVEGICIDGDKSYGAYGVEEEDDDEPAYLLRVTTFSLKLDENGDLTTGDSRRVRYYNVPEGTMRGFMSSPVAFWM